MSMNRKRWRREHHDANQARWEYVEHARREVEKFWAVEPRRIGRCLDEGTVVLYPRGAQPVWSDKP